MGLFNEQVARKPDKYPWAKDFVHAIWNGFWTPSEFSFRGDYGQFSTALTEQERGIVVRALSAIGQIEIAVKTFWANLGRNLPHPSISDLGFAMANSEVIHNLAYEKLLDVLGLEDVFEENLKIEVVKNRVQYLRKYAARAFGDDRKQYIYSIILFTLFVENVSLFSQFYTIMHFNRTRSVLKDTAQQVQYTRNEEMLHAQVGVKIINTLRQEYPELFDSELEAKIRHECEEALEAEQALIDWMLEDYCVEGLSADLVKKFIAKRMADSLTSVGYPAIAPEAHGAEWFEEELLGGTLTDFFEKRPVEYSRNDKTYEAEELFG